MLPFQGVIYMVFYSQGVAVGVRYIRLSAFLKSIELPKVRVVIYHAFSLWQSYTRPERAFYILPEAAPRAMKHSNPSALKGQYIF